MCYKNIYNGLSLNDREIMVLYICMEFYLDFEEWLRFEFVVIDYFDGIYVVFS